MLAEGNQLTPRASLANQTAEGGRVRERKGRIVAQAESRRMPASEKGKTTDRRSSYSIPQKKIKKDLTVEVAKKTEHGGPVREAEPFSEGQKKRRRKANHDLPGESKEAQQT